MCGIIYVRRADGKPARKQLLKRYRKQETRGSDGFGFVEIGKDNVLTSYERYQYESEMENAIKDSISTHILFHHRFPTSTPNLKESAHPIKVSHDELEYDYYVVHNGVLSNDTELREEHLKLGYKYSTEVQQLWRTTMTVYRDALQWNDSEALAIELARNIEKKTAMCKARGAIAYIVLQVEKQTAKAKRLYFGTNGGNPLTIYADAQTNNLCIASEGGKAVIANTCHVIDLKTLKLDTAGHVIMQPYAQPTYAGYNTGVYNNGGDYTYGGARESFKEREDYGLWDGEEIESEIAELEMQLDETRAGIQNAIDMGDLESEASLLDTERELKEALKKMERAYESSIGRIPF